MTYLGRVAQTTVRPEPDEGLSFSYAGKDGVGIRQPRRVENSKRLWSIPAMKGLKSSERHHWWPVAVSQHWKNDEGCTHWVRPSGEVKIAPPKNFGVIGNAHFVKLGDDPTQSVAWDENFEKEFHDADANFPATLAWLDSLSREDRTSAQSLRERYVPLPAPDHKLRNLVEGLVSLVVRSPLNRAALIGPAEKLRGPLPERERNTLIALNMRGCQRRLVSHIGTRAKFAVIFSPDREFVFGDGFYSNLLASVGPPLAPRVLVPLTPRISVLMARPSELYCSDPRLVTLVVTAEETRNLNGIIQAYSKAAMFYRTEAPDISEHFLAAEHMQFASSAGNIIAQMIESLPGVRVSA
jgi:hypothetical protein